MKINMNEGLKMDSGKPRLNLIPFSALVPVVRVLEFGAQKYSVNNWQKVQDPESRYVNAALRHLHAHAEGEFKDAESGLPHIAHCVCCLLFVLWFKREENE